MVHALRLENNTQPLSPSNSRECAIHLGVDVWEYDAGNENHRKMTCCKQRRDNASSSHASGSSLDTTCLFSQRTTRRRTRFRQASPKHIGCRNSRPRNTRNEARRLSELEAQEQADWNEARRLSARGPGTGGLERSAAAVGTRGPGTGGLERSAAAVELRPIWPTRNASDSSHWRTKSSPICLPHALLSVACRQAHAPECTFFIRVQPTEHAHNEGNTWYGHT